MDAALIALTDRKTRFTFRGEAFRSRKDIPNEDILDINFSEAKISDADVDALLPLSNLEGISFWNTDITDRAIEQLMTLSKLKRLNLCGTRITDASVPLLIQMSLEYIDVAETQITAEGLETLRSHLPHAEILA